MSKWQDMWATTKVTETTNEFAKIPAGKYVCKIAKAKIDETGAYGPKLSFGLVIHEGEFDGRWLWSNISLNDADGIARAKGLLMKLGHTCEGPSEVEVALEHLDGKYVEAAVMYKMGKDKSGAQKEFMNTYINGLAEVDTLPF